MKLKLDLQALSAVRPVSLTAEEKALMANVSTAFQATPMEFGLYYPGLAINNALRTRSKWAVLGNKTCSFWIDTPSVTRLDDPTIRDIFKNRTNAIDYVKQELKKLGFKLSKSTLRFHVKAKHPSGVSVRFNWGRDDASSFEGWELEFSK